MAMSPRAKWGAWIAVGAAVLGLAAGLWVMSRAVNRIPVLPELAGAGSTRLVEEDGRVLLSYENEVGRQNQVEPNDYFRLVWEERRAMGFGQKFMMKLFNVTGWGSMLFVAIGLLGQALFAGRLIVQWLATERSRRSVVPTAFWWMAISGASMLMVYFVWRKDLVGVLGQSTGWVIYMRNLYFIYFQHGLDHEKAEPGRDAEPAGAS